MVHKISLLALGAVANASQVSPVQKVLQMLGGMVAKGGKAMEQEKKIMADYNEWVSDENRRLSQNIQTADSDVEKLSAFITKSESDVAALGDEIAELDDLISENEKEFAEATKIRESENAEYTIQQADFAESVYAVQRAIETLKSQNYDRPQAMMLLQKLSTSKPAMRRVLAAFLEMNTHEPGAPDVAAYEFQSSGLVEMLEGLEKRFQKELEECEAAETNRAHNYNMKKTHLSNLIKNSKENRDEQAVAKADLTAKAARAKGDLAATQKAKAADEKTKAELNSIHEQKTATFAQNQEVRKAEIAALNKAVKIISSPDVSESYSGHINLVQKPSFLQTRSTSQRVAVKERAADLLRKRAQMLSSKMLAAVATDIAANPFASVIDMVKSLIAKLKEEAAAEADHKAWCDKELKDNKLRRNKKTAQSEKLQAEIEALDVTIQTQGKQIEALVKQQAEITQAMGEATSQRISEKADNKQTIEDAQAGAAAVQQALVVLRDFYSAQGTGFVQQVPEMAAYGGMQSAKGGVVGMLEVIVSDFVRLESDTKAAETEAAAEYDTFVRDSKAEKVAKHKLEVKTKLDKDQSEFDLSTADKMLRGVEEELAKATDYFEQLKPECIEVHVSFEGRVASRKAEIQALKDAHAILDQKRVEFIQQSNA